MNRSFLKILPLVVALTACGDGDPPAVDGGPPAEDAGGRADSGPRPDAGPGDAGGEDAGAPDAGAPDAGPLVEQTRVTALLSPSIITLHVIDDLGAPLVLEAAHAFDHDTVPGEQFFASTGSDRVQLGPIAAPDVTFTGAVSWADTAGAALSPDLIFAGAIGANPEVLIGTFGSQARLYDFATGRFGDAVPLTESPGGAPFVPISATTVDLGTGAQIVALKAGSDNLYLFDGSAFVAFPVAPTRCSNGTAIHPTIVVGAEIAGQTPPGGADSVILIEGSDAYVLESVSPTVCFGNPYPLVDADGAPVTPELAFGIDYDGNGTDDLILLDRVTL